MVTEQGPSVGQYRDRDIPAYIVADGNVYDYARLAHEDADGGCPLSQLAADECVVAPGLIYKRRVFQ